MDNLTRTPETVTHRRAKQVFALFAIVASFFVILEHQAHLIPYLPWLLLLACPLMHLFMHHGHGGHEHGDHERSKSQADTQSPPDEIPPGISSPNRSQP
jgi:hypothetical protein